MCHEENEKKKVKKENEAKKLGIRNNQVQCF